MLDQSSRYPELFERLRPATDSGSQIEVCGAWDGQAHFWEIDLAPVFNKLIELAGRHCQMYSSDILIDIDSVLQNIAKIVPDRPGVEGTVYSQLFGFRDMGTDHAGFIHCRLSSKVYGSVKTIYPGGIWQLDMQVERQANNYALFCRLFPVAYVAGRGARK